MQKPTCTSNSVSAVLCLKKLLIVTRPGVRGSIKTDDFDTRLAGLWIHERKVRQVIAMRTVKKTLELSDAMLSIFHL